MVGAYVTQDNLIVSENAIVADWAFLNMMLPALDIIISCKIDIPLRALSSTCAENPLNIRSDALFVSSAPPFCVDAFYARGYVPLIGSR